MVEGKLDVVVAVGELRSPNPTFSRRWRNRAAGAMVLRSKSSMKRSLRDTRLQPIRSFLLFPFTVTGSRWSSLIQEHNT